MTTTKRTDRLAAERASMLSQYRDLEPSWSWTHEDGSDARVYMKIGRAYLIAFAGKSGKPALHFTYRNETEAIERGIGFIRGRKAHGEFVSKRRATRSAFHHTLTVGTVLVESWGYDQTNIDYYEVTRVVGPQTVAIRPIGQRAVEDGPVALTGSCWPLAGSYTGPEAIKRVSEGNAVKIRDWGSWAYPWEPKADHWTAYA